MKCRVRVLGVDAEVAESFASRFAGLMARRGLPPGAGMLFRRCRAVHTLFMRFPIDVVFLGRDGRVVKAVRGVKPWRPCVWGGWRAASVLELDSRNGDLEAALAFAASNEK